MQTVAIFRHHLFKGSEPFIAQQAAYLTRYRPIHVGRQRAGEAPSNAGSIALSDLSPKDALPQKLWLALTRDPRPFTRLLAGYNPVLIHAHFGIDAVYGLRVAQQLKLPLVTTFHGFDATLSTRALMLSRSPALINYALFRSSLIRDGRLFLCVSRFIYNQVRALGFPAERTRLHYIGIDVDRLQPREIEEERPLILHVARLVEKKGTRYLLDAFSRCVQRHPQFRLVIIGDGPLKHGLKTLAADLSLGDRAHFTGGIPHAEVLSWIRRASILALPSIRAQNGDAEGLGMALLEAAAQGVPLLGTLHGGIPEVIQDGQTGFLVPERDADALSRRLEDLMIDRELRQRMGVAARSLVERLFNIRTQTKKLESLYDDLLNAD